MGKVKIAVTVDGRAIRELDQLVSRRVYSNRSQAIEEAVNEKLAKLRRTRLAEECAKLDPREEQRLAEEGLAEDLKSWPPY
ncbi:MAG: ribbon-helix-helix domain-containing protein [Dehalococcoidia bacterium]|nr:ribbon-helix-helix domain-containing protein [Dehalococcoidia bacterium]